MKLKYLREDNEIKLGINQLTEIFKDEYPYYTTWISKNENEFKSYEKEVIALYEDGVVVGYAMIHNCNEQYMKINGIYIFEEYEGNGYASQFLNLLFNDCKEKGLMYMLIQTRLNNNAVVRLFNKTGFVIVGSNFHQIEDKDNWVAINDIFGNENSDEIVKILNNEYPGFQILNQNQIEDIINSNNDNPLVLRRKK